MKKLNKAFDNCISIALKHSENLTNNTRDGVTCSAEESAYERYDCVVVALVVDCVDEESENCD